MTFSAGLFAPLSFLDITFDPLRSFEIKYNLLNLASEVWAPNLIPSVPVDGPGEEIIDDGGLIIGGLRPLSDELAIEFPQRAMTLVSETAYYADGTRAGVMNPEDGYWTTRYIGSLIYGGEPGEESLSGIQTADGFIEWRGSAANSQMQYFLRDHLGSVRVIASDKNTVISRSDYLPFGVRMTGSGLCGENSSARSSYFGFSGKENEMWDGLDVMSGNTPHWLKGERYQHFGARAYDPVTCIFMQIDPMAEKYYGMTPYHYCADTPIRLSDTDGADWVDKVVGFVVGVATNIVPGTSGLRDCYSPTDASDYNNSLKATDTAAEVAGLAATLDGSMKIAVGAGEAAAGLAVASSVVGTPEGAVVAVNGVTNVVEGGIEFGVGVYLMARSALNSSDGYDRGSKTSFTQGSGDHAQRIEVEIPEGYSQTKFKSHGQKVYSNGKNYITPDKDGHNGGVWKMADSPENFSKQKRMGTYDANLKRIGD